MVKSPRKLSLDGAWRLTGHSPDGGATQLELEARVPGQVHVDLLEAGLIPDPFWRDQADQCQWVENWDWTYTRAFELPADFESGWNVLEFDGLDTFATVTLNGVEVGCSANMFIPHRFEVGEWLRPGTNELTVHFTTPGKALVDKPSDTYEAAFSSDRVHARKLQCTYGWDWVHRFVSAGIWRSTRLVTHAAARIEDVFVYTKAIGRDAARLHIEINTESRAAKPLMATFEIADDGGRVVTSNSWPLSGSANIREVEVPSPKLWWPNGYGDQSLYTCRVDLHSDDGVLDATTVSFGVRTVELEQIPDDKGSSFTFVVNGERIFAKGGNWVPADPFPARITAERYDRLMQLAAEGHVNMLRAWGGGIYEPDAFWDACDRYGIMITQDFLLACAHYPEEDSEFLDALRVEFEAAIRMLRNRPSLVLWAGDNELGMTADPSTDYWGKKTAREVSEPLCRDLDPSRPYRPTSPFGGNPNNSPDAGDCHIAAWADLDFWRGDMADYRARLDACWGRFASEYPVLGTPSMRSLLKCMTRDDMADADPRMWEYHLIDNPHKGSTELTFYGMLRRMAANFYGASDDPDIFVRHMTYMQCEWVRLVAEALRRRKYDCSGVLFWMFNDCWPASAQGVTDYYALPRAAYYGMKRGFQPLIAAIEPTDTHLRVWLCNDTLDPVECELSVRFQPWSGEARWSMGKPSIVPMNGPLPAIDVPRSDVGVDGVLVVDVTSDVNIDRAWYFAGLPRDMELPTTTLSVEQSDSTITVAADHYARVVTLDADLIFSDNYFDLLPGEERAITWRDPDGVFDGTIPVSCWNEA